jgi:hypothetical protein
VECKNKSNTSKTGATGTTSKSLRKFLSNIPGEREIKDLQETVIFCTVVTHASEGNNEKILNIQNGK